MKYGKYLLRIAFVVSVLLSLCMIACQKESSSDNSLPAQSQHLSVYLTDDAAPFDSVFLDIRYVEVKTDTSVAHQADDHYGDKDSDGDDDHHTSDAYGIWDTLSIDPGVYNILQLRNGVDTLLASGNIQGTIRKIRITLGNNNAVVVGGVRHPLLLSAANPYIYLKIHKEHRDQPDVRQTELWIDVDVSRSVWQQNGQYYLKPVVKPFGMHNSGRIEGVVLPSEARPVITAYNEKDTATAIPEKDGTYKMSGLTEDVYKILFKPFNGYRDTTLTNVHVQKGSETHVATLFLHP